MDGTIFINYRRDDTKGVALALKQQLERHFKKDRVFLDLHGMQAGDEFDKTLTLQVTKCDAMLVLIGEQWLTLVDDVTKERRLCRPNDFVRYEIASALDQRKLILPVTIDQAVMPTEVELSDNIRPLAKRHAALLRTERFDADLSEIVKALKEKLEARKPKGMTRWGVAIVSAVSGANREAKLSDKRDRTLDHGSSC
jgi:hypothetical protein